MKLLGSKQAFIICSECQKESPRFRVYLFRGEEYSQWQGELPNGWACSDEASLDTVEDWIIGNCPEHKEEA